MVFFLSQLKHKLHWSQTESTVNIPFYEWGEFRKGSTGDREKKAEYLKKKISLAKATYDCTVHVNTISEKFTGKQTIPPTNKNTNKELKRLELRQLRQVQMDHFVKQKQFQMDAYKKKFSTKDAEDE